MKMAQEANTRETILITASHLYATRGYEAVSMRDIASAVGVTPANLYYHFRDKESLVREALAYVFREKTAPMEIALSDHKTPREQFRFFIGWFVHLIFEDPIFSRLLFRELLDGSSERIEYLYKTVFNHPFSILSRIIQDYSGNSDASTLTVSVIGMILGHYQLSKILPYSPEKMVTHENPDYLIMHFITLLEKSIPSHAEDKKS